MGKDKEQMGRFRVWVISSSVTGVIYGFMPTFIDGDSRALTIVLDDQMKPRTDGKTIWVSLIPDAVKDFYSNEDWLILLQAIAAHEAQHVNSSKFDDIVQIRDWYDTYLNNHFGLDASIGGSIAQKALNIVEDGRIEAIAVRRRKGLYLPLRFLNQIIREGTTIEPCDGGPKKEYEDFWAQVLSYAKTGLYAPGSEFYKNSELENAFLSVSDYIDQGVCAKSSAECRRLTEELLIKVAPYLAKLLNQSAELRKQCSQDSLDEYTSNDGKPDDEGRDAGDSIGNGNPLRAPSPTKQGGQGQGKGDLAIKVAMMAEHYGRPFIYFDPSYKNCPKFNPLAGREVDVVGNIATTFKMLNPDSPQFFLDLNEQLVSNAVKVLKRLDRDVGIEGKWATFINLGRLLQNSGGQGRDMVNNFARISAPTDSEAKENADIATWFLNDYFPERSKVYENTSGVRSQVAKLVSNEYLREALNPDVDKGEKNEVNFDKHLMEGGIICISTAQGALRDLSKYLGYFIILSLQSSVFRRPGTEATRRAHFLYIDEFQTYSTPGFADMLTQGRAYRVGSILATQARAQMAMGGGRDGKNFVELVSSNARNVVLFPGVNKDDAKYYSEQFGEFEKVEVMVGTSRKKFNLLTGGLDSLGHPTEMVREQKKMTANFTTTDLIFGQEVGNSFTEIVYSIIKNNSVQPAKVGKISYIPKELNKLLDTRIAEYSALYARESAAEYYARESQTAAAPEAPEDTLTFFDGPDAADNEVEDLAGGEDDSAFASIATPVADPDEADDLLGEALRYSTAPETHDDDVIDWSTPAHEEEADEPLISSVADIFDGVFDDD